MRRIYKKISHIFKRKSVGSGLDAAVADFFEEVREYKDGLIQSLFKVLGEENAQVIVNQDKTLLHPNAYLFKRDELEEFALSGFSSKENLLFYVGVDLEENDDFKIAPGGFIRSASGVLKTFPLFFLEPERIRERARHFGKISLPGYFTPWLHEYCHFIGYCVQEIPIGAAYAILYAELLKSKKNKEGLAFQDITETVKTSKDEPSAKVAEIIFHLHRLDEGMANFLQGLFLRELGFNPGDYFDELMQENPYNPYFKKWGIKKFMDYMVDWNNAKLQAPEFMKNFLKSLNDIEVERHAFEG